MTVIVAMTKLIVFIWGQSGRIRPDGELSRTPVYTLLIQTRESKLFIVGEILANRQINFPDTFFVRVTNVPV